MDESDESKKIREDFLKDMKKSKGRFALMCGAGVSMAISNDSRSWDDFVDQFARKVIEVLNLSVDFTNRYEAQPGMMAKITFVNDLLNVNWEDTGVELRERHRMIAQLILRRLTLNRSERGLTLHRLGLLILTTNYDTVIEDCVPRDRLSLSHVEARAHINPGVFTDGKTMASGPFFGSPLAHLLVHLHGRYFDIGREHGFCFTQEEYDDINMLNAFLLFMVDIVKNEKLVFIGAKGTVCDAHFMALWRTVGRDSKTHYILHQSDETAEILRIVAAVGECNVEIIPIRYGDDHDQLWPFLVLCTPEAR